MCVCLCVLSFIRDVHVMYRYCIDICANTHNHIYVLICIYIIYIHTSVNIYINKYLYNHVYVCAQRMCKHVEYSCHACVYVYIIQPYIYIFIYLFIYIYIHV